MTLSRIIPPSERMKVGEKVGDWQPYPYQLPPSDNLDDWDYWLLLGGRGSGKTEAGARYTLNHMRALGRRARVGVMSPSLTSAREVCAEGESGLMTIGGSEFRDYHRSLAFLEATHRDGGYVRFMGSDNPDSWNGPQWTLLWVDELALVNKDAFDMAQFGVRLGEWPRTIGTTTPKTKKWVRELAQGPRTVTTHGTLYDNTHLVKSVARRLEERYGGTRLGRQELLGEFVDDVDGAYWSRQMLEDGRVAEPPFILRVTRPGQPPRKLLDFIRIVVAVDPAVTATKDSDYTAIVVAGLATDGYYYVLDSAQYKLSPGAWGQRALDYYRKWEADAIVGEVNNGGDLVKANVEGVAQAVGVTVRFIEVRASRGKAVRAEPVVGLYEQGKVRHVGMHPDLEDQQCEFPVANENDDLVDAAVYALTELSGVTPLEVRFM